MGICAKGRRAVKTVALALGSGGARGLANITVLEAFDELGVRPVALAGASAGALIGAAYAAGLSGREIRRHVIALAHDRAEVLRRLVAARVPGLPNFFAAPLGNPMLIDAEKFVAAFLPETIPATFEELKIPLTVVAADLYGRREVVFRSGPLRPALAASMAVPGLVQPRLADGRVLVDGGAVDPMPFGQLSGRADVVAAIDCSAGRDGDGQVPDPWECIFATLTVMGQTIVAEKLKHGAPDLIVRPNVGQFRLLDFFLASAILRAAEPVKAEVKEKLVALLG
jgi:NTE family protein